MPATPAPSVALRNAPSLNDGRLLECVVTSCNEDGSTNIAPMGPIVDDAITRVLLRPFQSSLTFANLQRERRCILHITDDVELIARSALNLLEETPAMTDGPGGGRVLAGACRWFALSVEAIDASRDRAEVLCRVEERGRLRDFIGFNRAMHAVIEATILATRLAIFPADEVHQQLPAFATAVEKTGGPRERRAFALVDDYIACELARNPSGG
ncbi:MAG: DUF447 domain-containing protein [Planctomycetota bacterium]